MHVLRVRHLTRYRYARPVRFGEHVLMLRPRDDADQRVIVERMVITPEPRDLRLTQDGDGNWVALAQFEGAAGELCIESEVQVERWPALESPEAINHPDPPGALDRATDDDPDGQVARWALGFLPCANTQPDFRTLAAITRTVHADFSYRRRLEHGVHPAWRTLQLRSGACRDYAVLLIQAARALGFKARFASGYVHSPGTGGEQRRGGGHTHAWANIFVPGQGWVDFDATSGRVGCHGLVRVAVADHPTQAIPIQGVYFGGADDFLGMDVEVEVEHAASPNLVGGASEPQRLPRVAFNTA